MKSRMVLIIFLLLINSSSFANSNSDTTKVFRNHSLQFRASLTNLSNFKGSLISHKYHFSDNNAVRTCLSINSSNYDQDTNRGNYGENDLYVSQEDNCDDVYIEFIVQGLHYFNPNKEYKFFAGIGPRVLVNVDKSDTDKLSGSYFPDAYNSKTRNDYYEYGVTFSYGLEWFFKDNISLHTEYGFNFSYFHENIGSTRTFFVQESEPDITLETTYRKKNGYRFQSLGVLLGLSVYL